MIGSNLHRGILSIMLLTLLILISHCSSPEAVDWSVNSNILVTYETEFTRSRILGNRIFVNNPDDLSDTIFFSTRGNLASTITINHRSQMMAVLSIVVGALEPKTIDELSRNILQVVDSDGILVSELDIGLLAFCFNPDGKKIAFTTGILSPGREYPYVNRVGVLDIPTDSITWVLDTVSAPNYRIGFEIVWPRDGHIYMSAHRKILKVNEEDFSITTLDIIGSANISPDGRFQYDLGDPYMGSNIRILDISNGTDVSASVYALIGDDLERSNYIIHLNWLSDVGSLLLIGLIQMRNADGTLRNTKLTGKHTFLINVGTGVIVMHKTGEKLRVVNNGGSQASSSPFAVEDESGAIKLDAYIMRKLRALKIME